MVSQIVILALSNVGTNGASPLKSFIFFYSTTKQLHELETERKKVVQQLKEKDAKCQGTVLVFYFSSIYCAACIAQVETLDVHQQDAVIIRMVR